jgi:hypothetical protein
MFQIEIHIDDIGCLERMVQMWTWLNQRRLEPTTFRYEFTTHGIICRVDFPIEADAAAFATSFDGKLVNELQLEPIP